MTLAPPYTPTSNGTAAASVATLVAAPGRLPADLVSRVAAVLPGAGPPRWLGADTAADIPFAPPASIDNRRWTDTGREALAGSSVDIVVQPAFGRRKRLLLADMDATLIEEECIDELAAAHGCGPQVAAITARSTRGAVDFAASLVERVALLRGLPLSQVEAIVSRVSPVPGAAVLSATMRAHGALAAIASGGFTLFTAPLAIRLGFDRHFANALEIEDGRVAGTIKTPLFGPDAKRDVLRALCAELHLVEAETLAVGDGANDLPMLGVAGLGVAFRAKPAVAAASAARIDHADLSALLYLQGYARSDFVA